MAAPLLDMHVQNVIQYGLKLILSDPKRYLGDIFGNAKLDPHAAIYGNRLLDQVEKWFTTTRINVILGFDLTQVELPCVTVNLQSSGVSQPVLGDDTGFVHHEHLQAQEREIIVPAFQFATAVLSADRQTMAVTLPASMPLDQQQYVIAGLLFRDGKGLEYQVGVDDEGNISVVQNSADAPVAQMDLTQIEVISPVLQARFNRNAAVFDDQVVVAVHGHANKNEGLWLYYIVMWCLLKLRPVLQATFGIDLSMPVASDFSKSSDFAGDNVWQRFITMNCKTVWTWEAARQSDILGLLLNVTPGQASS